MMDESEIKAVIEETLKELSIETSDSTRIKVKLMKVVNAKGQRQGRR